jgi:hypothetical protein
LWQPDGLENGPAVAHIAGMAKSHTFTVTLSKKSDEKVIRLVAKHLNRNAGGLRAARTKRKTVKK